MIDASTEPNVDEVRNVRNCVVSKLREIKLCQHVVPLVLGVNLGILLKVETGN